MAELYNPNSLPADFVKVYGGTEDSVKIFSSPARRLNSRDFGKLKER